MRFLPLVACGLALAAAAPTAAVAAPARKKLPPRTGGDVRAAWPKAKRKAAPDSALERAVARQAGPARRTSRRPHARAALSAGGVPFSATDGSDRPLQLIRSYGVPVGDAAYDRVANLAWTYDSALAAISFDLSGERAQAIQQLDQLAALQRADGSLEYAYDVSTGAGAPLFRTGTMALVGLAATRHDGDAYDRLADGAARWLAAREIPARGLLVGGPDVAWVSSQHNIWAQAFLARHATEISLRAKPLVPTVTCIRTRADGKRVAVLSLENPNQFSVAVPGSTFIGAALGAAPSPALPATVPAGSRTGVAEVVVISPLVTWKLGLQVALGSRSCRSDETFDGPYPAGAGGPSPADLNALAGRIAAGIDRELFASDRFRTGIPETERPAADAQALGVLWLHSRLRLTDARRVATALASNFALRGGIRASDRSDAIWGEGTYESALALTLVGLDTRWLEPGMAALWPDGVAMPYAVDQRASDLDLYRWPAVAPAVWALLGGESPL